MIKEKYISVDIETAGPNPANYALLSIGACLIDEPHKNFYVELKPDREKFEPRALEITGLSMEVLKKEGMEPKKALLQFSEWLDEVVPDDAAPVFTAFNAPFDWMFINDYYHRYIGENPFGHKALDIKAFYMGIRKTTWLQTSYEMIAKELGLETKLPHHALEDAIHQAKIFQVLEEEMRGKNDTKKTQRGSKEDY